MLRCGISYHLLYTTNGSPSRLICISTDCRRSSQHAVWKTPLAQSACATLATQTWRNQLSSLPVARISILWLEKKVATPNKKGRSGVFFCNTSLTICKLMTFERTRRAGLLATPLKQFPLLEFRQRLLQCDFLQHLSHEVLGNGEKDKSPKLHFITPLLRIPWLLDSSRSNLSSPLTRIAFRASFRLTVSREFSNVILPCERRNN